MKKLNLLFILNLVVSSAVCCADEQEPSKIRGTVWGIIDEMKKIKQPVYQTTGSLLTLSMQSFQPVEQFTKFTGNHIDWYYSKFNASHEHIQKKARNKDLAQKIKKEIF